MAQKKPTGSSSLDCDDRLITTCRTALGDSLRSVTYFTSDEYEQVYLRSDLEQDADLSSFTNYEWRGFGLIRDAYEGSELGDYEYTIRVFANGFLVRVTTEAEGVFVTTDGLTTKDFHEMATAVKQLLTQ